MVAGDNWSRRRTYSASGKVRIKRMGYGGEEATSNEVNDHPACNDILATTKKDCLSVLYGESTSLIFPLCARHNGGRVEARRRSSIIVNYDPSDRSNKCQHDNR